MSHETLVLTAKVFGPIRSNRSTAGTLSERCRASVADTGPLKLPPKLPGR